MPIIGGVSSGAMARSAYSVHLLVLHHKILHITLYIKWLYQAMEHLFVHDVLVNDASKIHIEEVNQVIVQPQPRTPISTHGEEVFCS